MNSKNIGVIGEELAIVECLLLGIDVSRPIGDNSRYDLVLDINGILYKCQVKSNNRKCEELVEFPLQSSQAHRGQGKQAYSEDILFLLVDIYKKQVFLFKNIENKTSVKLRYLPTLNNQSKGVLWAKDYLLSSCVETLHDAPLIKNKG
jgi:hypothetical protein